MRHAAVDRPSERNPKFLVGTYESITREASIKTTWVGKKPGHRPGKLSWEAAPVDVWPTDHGRQGALSEKGDRTRGVMPHLGFKSESGLSKFLRRDLSRPLGRPANDGSYAAAIFEQTLLVLRLETHISETGEMQHRPEAICSIREIVARESGAQSRI